jgi:hypothetical protein
MNANALYHAPNAIDTMLCAGLITARQAAKAKKDLATKLNAAIEYYSEKGFTDVVEGLNNAWRKTQ